MAYQKYDQIGCCFSSLGYSFESANQLYAENKFLTWTISSPRGEILDKVMFENNIMTD